MKKGFLAMVFCLLAACVWGQTNGSYRSRQSGNWNQATTWQVFNSGWNDLESAGAGTFQNSIPSNARNVITISSNTTVTVPTGFEISVDQLEFGPTAAVLTVATGGILNITNGPGNDVRFFNNGVSFSQLLLSGFVRLLTGATMVNDNYAGTVVPASNATTVNTYKVLNGGTHIHASFDALPYAQWQVGSSITFYATNTNPIITDPTVQFYNFGWDGRAQIANLSFNGNLRTVNGSFTIFDTSNRALTLGGATNYTMNIGGNFRILGTSNVFLNSSGTVVLNVGTVSTPGNFQVTGGTVNSSSTGGSLDLNVTGNFSQSGGTILMRAFTSSGTGTTNFNITGDFTQTGGTITRTSGGTANINFIGAGTTTTFSRPGGTIVSNINYNVTTGKTLAVGTSALTGTGQFTMVNGSILTVGSLEAGGPIQSTTAAGNIRVAGPRTYQAGSTIIYNGAGAQFMGSGHPATPHTIIDNVADVTMVSNVTINGNLTVNDGFLLIENNTLTMGGTYSAVGGSIAASTLSNITINGTGDFGDLIIAFSQFPDNPINNLSINRTAGTVFLGTNLIVGGTFTQTSGNFSLGEFNPFTLTLRGPVVQSAGSFLTYTASSLVIDGAGVLPADVNIIGPNLGTLTMNRAARTFVSNSTLTVTNLNLFNGVVNNSAFNITMAASGIVTRRSTGSIVTVLGAVTSFDVVYDVATDITTGNELPFTSPVTTRLANLTKLGTATVNLNKELVVNGTFTITQGQFDVEGNDITIRRDLVVDGTINTQDQSIIFAGSVPQTISGSSSIAFYDVFLSQTSPSTLDIETPVSVLNSLTVTSASVLNAGNQLLTLVSNATRTAFVGPRNAGANIAGTVIAQRHLPNTSATREYRYIAPPVSGSTVADWKVEMSITGSFSDPVVGPGIVSNSPSMFRWEETFVSGGTYRYRPYPISGLSSAAPITLGRGYSVFGRTFGAIIYDSRGTLGQGTVPVAVTNSGGASPGWNLIGNPYPAPLDWDLVAASLPGAVENAIYFTDNNDNVTGSGGNVSYINGVGVPASFNGIIASGQAFFVHTNANATINFQESHKAAGQAQFIREASITNLLRVVIKNGNTSDEVALRLHEDATNGFDEKFDAFKFFKDSPVSMSMLMNNDQKLVINSVNPMSCGLSIPLLIETMGKGSFSLDFTGIETFEFDHTLRLNDKLLGKLLDLRTTNNYTFTTDDAAALANRFELIIGTPMMDETLDVLGGVACQPGPFQLVVRNPVSARYNWYENANDAKPIKGATGPEFVTPALSESRTYYVAALNSSGCEGKRFAVDAKILRTEPATIEMKGSTLISNYDEGNRWFYNNVLLSEDTKTVETIMSGTYSLEVDNFGCKQTTYLEVQLEENIPGGLNVVVYPNPTPDKIIVEVRSAADITSATLISPIGLEVNSTVLQDKDGIRRGDFDVTNYPAGIYMIQIKDGNKLFIRKVSKIK